MFGNYLAAALRNLDRNKSYAAVTIVGLALSFAAAILIALYVRDEFSYDRWIPGYKDVYIVAETLAVPGQKPVEIYGVPTSMTTQVKLDDPQVSAAAVLFQGSPVVRHGAGDIGVRDQGFVWADPDIFKVLPLPVVAGDLKTALQEPDTVVLTRSAARTYFGRDNPIGDTLDVAMPGMNPDGTAKAEQASDHHLLRVTAVLQDLPSDTHLGVDIFASGLSAYSPLGFIKSLPGSDALTYLRLSPGGSRAELQRVLDAAGRQWAAAFPGLQSTWTAVPLADMHMRTTTPVPFPSSYLFSASSMAGDPQVAAAIAVVGMLIVLIGSTNFVTLMTARSGRRALEVGVRKVGGAGGSDLIVQFLGEALIYVALSMLVAMALAELALPAVNAALRRTMRFNYLGDPTLAGGIIATVLIVSLLAGIYPAFVLSSFRPAAVLRGGIVSGTTGSPLLRQTLVALQFAILIGLILTTMTIYRQTSFALARALGGADPIIGVYSNCNSQFPDAVRRLPSVQDASCSGLSAIDVGGRIMFDLKSRDGKSVPTDMESVDFNFFSVFKIKPIAGRLFSRDYGEDGVLARHGGSAQPTIVINQTAARKLGFASPEQAIGQTMLVPGLRVTDHGLGPIAPTQIVGVVPDIPTSVRATAAPTFYYVNPNQPGMVVARTTAQDLPAVVREIERAWKQVGDGGPIQLRFMSQLRIVQYIDIVIQTAVVAACAAMALFVACLGLFALSAFTAEQRTKEIGIRKAMGASTWDVVRLLMWRFTQPVLLANLIAWPLAWLVMDRWLRTFAYHVDLPLWQFVMAAALAIAIAWVTIGSHALLVARAKPAMALRYE